MKHKLIQYLVIILILSAIAGGYFYFRGQAAQKINSSQTPKLTDGLVGYWTFDGADMTATTATDKSPVGSSSGTLVGAGGSQNKPQPKIGKTGQGLNFDGTDDYVSIPAASGNPLDIDSNPVTISTWIKINTLPADIASFISRGSVGQGVGYGMFLQSNGDLRVGGHGGGQIGLSGTTLTTGTWYHVVGIANGSSSAIYLNGSLNNTGTVDVVSDNKNFWLGASCGDASCIAAASMDYFFNGSLDETRIYSRALSQSEITELYQQGQTKINASQVNKLTDGLVAYYTMDGADTAWSGASAGTVTDKSPGGTNTGTLNNMSQSASPAIGKVGQALYFDGSNDYITKTGATGLPQGNNSFSVSVWTKPAKGAANYMVSWGYPNYVNNLWNAFVVTGSKLYHIFYGNDLSGGTTLTVNGSTWYHAVVTYDRDTNLRKIYLNGTVDASAVPSNGTPTVDGSELRIAMDPVGDYIGKGTLDEVRIYNRALSQSEITELYQQGQTKINASQTGKLTDGLVAHYPFDGNYVDWGQAGAEIRDASGNNYHGDAANMTTASAAIGKIGQALSFNGTNQYINLGDQAAFDFGTGNFAISFWYKVPGYKNQCFLCKDDWSTYNSPGFLLYGGDSSGGASTRAMYFFDTGDRWVKETYAADTSWHHIVVTREGTGTNQLKSYADGSLTFSQTDSASMNNSRNLVIGADSDGNEVFFQGTLDEVRIYSRYLSASEVTELYNMGR